ncbi:MAG: YggT family protein [Candidatus Cloacimonetes bacterium]|jgi:YggT family protein|nr:YggT family protein [Candidatus Cloacimonadota bacterium]MDY0337090.1 YggT family protein [Candidatus Cloacimonadaceae bacterium]MCB5269035.1 YggT family protein [Candidatus Cloacimonadota bacterium]MCK9334411.1 YggT family protein [Candidatus Cloacimonadota bacterium]MDD2543918.1 YggT family protein [Candidatus Cloacimonadota bacterium]
MYSPSYLVIKTLINAISIYNVLIFVRVIFSWIIQDHSNPLYRFLYGITEPVLAPLRRVIPTNTLDFSPIVAYFLLRILAMILQSLL